MSPHKTLTVIIRIKLTGVSHYCKYRFVRTGKKFSGHFLYSQIVILYELISVE